jgi:hypothetical protein
MTAYQTTPFKPTPQLLVPNIPSYVWGSFNDKTGPTTGKIISTSGNGTTSTVVIQITGGNVPIVSSLSTPLITIVGSANASGAYNVTNVALASISAGANPDSGIYTVTFLGSGNSAVAADTGQFIIPQPEVGETVSGTGSSVPVAVGANGPTSSGKSLSVSVTLPAGSLSGVTINVQGSNFDVDSAYNTIGVVGTGLASGTTTDWQSGQGDTATGTLAAGSVTFPNFRFYRLNISALTGSGSIIAKIMD